jgi:hypothetical protein
MAKIPQGEWNAIAARYAKGESISKIARSYSCTPPAIHYILKRNRQNAANNLEQSLNGRSDSPRAIIRQSAQTPTASHLSEAPSNWWTPLLSSGGSGKVSNEPGTASFYR